MINKKVGIVRHIMGLLVNGEWTDGTGPQPVSDKGEFVRPVTQFRNWITRDGSSGFPAEHDRYHLYISHACPWAHRTLIMRSLKHLENSITVSVVDPYMYENGWEFSDFPGSTPDHIFGSRFLYQVYQKADPTMTGRVTVPILWDKKNNTIVNNESAEIITMLNNSFDGEDFYPEELRGKIDEINAWIYDKINNGVYKAGFATAQKAYDDNVTELFSTLDKVDEILGQNRYLVGGRFTLADLRLFTTLVRFDAVYVGHFKCNLKRIEDYQNLPGYIREIYQMPGVAETVNMLHIKNHYYSSHKNINPTGIVPKGPLLDFTSPHNRDRQYPN